MKSKKRKGYMKISRGLVVAGIEIYHCGPSMVSASKFDNRSVRGLVREDGWYKVTGIREYVREVNEYIYNVDETKPINLDEEIRRVRAVLSKPVKIFRTDSPGIAGYTERQALTNAGAAATRALTVETLARLLDLKQAEAVEYIKEQEAK